MASPAFTPPPISSWQGPADTFVPPPVSSWQGPAQDTPYEAPGAKPGQAAKNQAILDRMEKEQSSPADALTRGWEGLKSAVASPTPVEQGVQAYKAKDYGGVAKALARTVLGPAYDVGAGIVGQGTQAVKAALAKRPLEAVGHAAAALIPGVGPMAADIGDTAGGEPEMPPGQQLEDPHPMDVAGAVGKSIPLAAGLAAQGARAAYSKLTAADPTTAMVRALKPTPTDSGFMDRLPDTMSRIKANADQFDPNTGLPIRSQDAGVTGVESLRRAAQNTVKDHQQTYELWKTQARNAGVQLPVDGLVKATIDAIPGTMWDENPAGAQAIVDKAANAYAGKQFDVDRLDQTRAEKTAELDGFYDKATGKQIASEIAGAPLAVVKAQADAARDILYNGLDPQNGGAGPRQIKAQQGDALDILNAAERRRNAIRGEKPVSTGEEWKRRLTNIANVPGDVLTGEIGKSTPVNGPSDLLIRRAFENIGPPAPLPLPPGMNPTQAQITAGTIKPAPPAGTPTYNAQTNTWTPSGINVTTGPTLRNQIPVNRQLPRATPGLVEPIPMPSTDQGVWNPKTRTFDKTDINVTTGPPLQVPVSRQLPAGPSQLPYNADETPAGGPLETVQVIGPDGEPYFTTQPRYPTGTTIPPTGPPTPGAIPPPTQAGSLARAIIDAQGGTLGPNGTQAASQAGAGRQPAVLGPSPPRNPVGIGAETTIRIPGDAKTAYKANYALRELEDVYPSHNPVTLQKSPDYQLENTRNYADPRNAERILKQFNEFDPEYLTTESPTAENGAPIIDKNGNVYGGNSRAITLARVYGSKPDGAQAYRSALTQKAQQYGLDPNQVASMRNPVLVRELSGYMSPEDTTRAVTDMNKVGTANLTPGEQALADSNRVTPQALDLIGSKIEQQGPEGTLAKALEGDNGRQVVQKLIDDGVIAIGEKNKYLDNRNLVTEEGKNRISKLLTGRLFADPSQFDSTPPELRNKLEKVSPVLSRVVGSDWDITPHVKEAMQLVTEARQRGTTVKDLTAQSAMFPEAVPYSPEAIAIAKSLEKAPTKAVQDFRQYVNEAQYAQQGPTLYGAPPTMQESVMNSFGDKMPVPNGFMPPPR